MGAVHVRPSLPRPALLWWAVFFFAPVFVVGADLWWHRGPADACHCEGWPAEVVLGLAMMAAPAVVLAPLALHELLEERPARV